MKIKRKNPRFALSFRIKQFPWKFSKLIQLKRRKWLKVKFSTRFSNLNKTGRAVNFKFFRTYKKRVKKLFQLYFAPKLTDRQCTKLLRLNSRYKSTFKKVLQSEQRLDVLVCRFYMLSDVTLARELIKKNFFLLNNKTISSVNRILSVGEILSISNLFSWQFLYQNMLKVVSSLIKYFNRLFLKFSFPFVIKRRNFHFKEYGKFKNKIFRYLNLTYEKRLTTRQLYLRYKKVKPGSLSKTRPPKKYYFKLPEFFKEKRLKQYFLKKALIIQNPMNFLKMLGKRIHRQKIARQLRFVKRILTPKLLHFKKKKISRKVQKFNRIKLRKKNNKQKATLIKRLLKKRRLMFKKRRLEKRKRRILKNLKTTNIKLSQNSLEKEKKTKITLEGRKKLKVKFKGLEVIFPQKSMKNKSVKEGKIVLKDLKKLLQVRFLGRKNRHFQFLFSNPTNLRVKFAVQQLRTKKTRWKKWAPVSPKNFWQMNRITKKNVYFFRYLKKFYNRYKQNQAFQKLNQISWKSYKNFWQKTSFLFEKKKKKLLSQNFKSLIYIKNKTKTLDVYKKFSKKDRVTKEKIIFRIKRKYLQIKGFTRRYKNFKLNIQFTPEMLIYSPIQIQYKKINLLFKHRPIAFFFAEVNYNTLEFTILADVDFIFFPYKSLFDFKTLSLMV